MLATRRVVKAMWATWMVVHMASFQQAGLDLERKHCSGACRETEYARLGDRNPPSGHQAVNPVGRFRSGRPRRRPHWSKTRRLVLNGSFQPGRGLSAARAAVAERASAVKSSM